ncbi:MAG: alanine--tRNA ligase, partial [Chloroflexi bacterium]
VRRIEAVTGTGALREMRETRERLARTAATLRVPPARVPEAVTQLHEQRDRLQHELEAKQRSGVEAAAAGLLDKAELIGAAKVIAANVGEGDVQQLRALSDRIRAAIGSGVVVLGGVREGKPNLVIAVTKNLVTIVDADELVKEVQGIIDGRGGGRPESASAGGKDATRLGEAVEAARSAVRQRLNGGRDR